MHLEFCLLMTNRFLPECVSSWPWCSSILLITRNWNRKIKQLSDMFFFFIFLISLFVMYMWDVHDVRQCTHGLYLWTIAHVVAHIRLPGVRTCPVYECVALYVDFSPRLVAVCTDSWLAERHLAGIIWRLRNGCLNPFKVSDNNDKLLKAEGSSCEILLYSGSSVIIQGPGRACVPPKN